MRARSLISRSRGSGGGGACGRPAPPRPRAAREPRVPRRAEVTGRRWRPSRAPAPSPAGRSPRPASAKTQAGMEECRVLSIQSHVVRGYVGNRAATFPLQVLLRNPRGPRDWPQPARVTLAAPQRQPQVRSGARGAGRTWGAPAGAMHPPLPASQPLPAGSLGAGRCGAVARESREPGPCPGARRRRDDGQVFAVPRSLAARSGSGCRREGGEAQTVRLRRRGWAAPRG